MSTSLYERSLRALFARVADADFRALLALLNPEFGFLCTPSNPVSTAGAAAGISSSTDPTLAAIVPSPVQQPIRTGLSHADDALLHLEALCAPVPLPALEMHEQHVSAASIEVRSLLYYPLVAYSAYLVSLITVVFFSFALQFSEVGGRIRPPNNAGTENRSDAEEPPPQLKNLFTQVFQPALSSALVARCSKSAALLLRVLQTRFHLNEAFETLFVCSPILCIQLYLYTILS